MGHLAPAILAFFSGTFRTRISLQMEDFALRHQLAVYRRSAKWPRLDPGGRLLWAWLSRIW